MIKLHHLNRSRSLRILWLLEELGTPYEVIHYVRDEKTNLAPADLAQIHPLGKSPVIEMNGRVIAESAAIVELLCAEHAPHMVPLAGTDAYAEHLEWMHFAEGTVMPPLVFMLYLSRLGEAGAPLHPRMTQQIDMHFQFMNDRLRPSGHYVLDDLSAVDIMLSFPAEIAIRQKRGGDFPRLAAFVDAIEARPAYARAIEAGRAAEGVAP